MAISVVEETIDIHGSLADVYAIARDMEKYPKYMPDVETVTVLTPREIETILADLAPERAAALRTQIATQDTTVTFWETLIEGTPIEWTELDSFSATDLDHHITYDMIKGDLHIFRGEWRFVEHNATTIRVTLRVEYDFDIPHLSELIGPTLAVKIQENSQMMLRGIKAAVESQTT